MAKQLERRTGTPLWLAGCALLGALLVVLWAGPAAAVHDIGNFELEGNALDDATAGDDSANVYCDDFPADPDCAGVGASSALVSEFFMDPVEDPADDIFDGATDTKNPICGPSDPGGCSDWGWKVGEPNDKNDIENAFAALYRDPGTGQFYVYFGLDKLDNSGDAALGFWFMQNDVVQLDDGTFSAPHRDGDVLVQADVTSGGDVPRIDVYTWGPNLLLNNPVQPAHGDLRLAINGGKCDPLVVNDPACAIMNPGDPGGDTNLGFEQAPWTHLFKAPGGVVTTDPAMFPTATYFEAGLNLSTLFPAGIPCISTFLAETRQSQSETAQLEDKLLGGFDLCSVFVQKTGPEKGKVGDDVTYTTTITNDGALPLNKGSIIDSLVGDLTDGTNPAITSSDCGATIDPNDSCTIVYTYTVQAGDSDPLENVVDVVYDRAGDEVTGSGSHAVDLFQPAIDFDKQVEGTDGPLVVLQGATVDYTLTPFNLSSDDTPVLECVVTDNLLIIDPLNTDGDNDPSTIGVTLAANQSAPVNASQSFPLPGDFTNTADVLCSPRGFDNQLTAMDSVTVTVLPGGQALMVEKDGDDFSKVGDDVNYTITITNIGAIPWTLTDAVDDVLGDLLDAANPFVTVSTCGQGLLVLNPNESCVISATRTTDAADPDPLVNTVDVTVEDAFGGSATVSDDHTVDLVAPDYTVSKSCISDQPVPAGQSANFRIDIVNTGDVNLVINVSDPVLGINQMDVLLGERGGAACGAADLDGDASDGCLRIEAGIIATGDQVDNTVDVSATLPAEFGLENVIDRSDDAVCDVEEAGATRTWGFWKTHGSDGEDFEDPVRYGYTCHVAAHHVLFPIDLGWTTLLNCEDAFGIFWASPAKESDGSKRDNLCRVKLHTSHQLLAAILNDGLSNGAAVPDDPNNPGTSIIDAAIAELGGDMNRRELIRLMGELAAYNESGDDVAIIDSDGAMIPHADPRGTRMAADETIADCQ